MSRTLFSAAMLLSASLWLGGIHFLSSISSKLPFSHLIRWARAASFEVLALIGVCILRFLPCRPTSPGKGCPILLVHGYVNHGSVWRFFQKRLERYQLGPIYTINLGHPFKSIQVYAEKVKKQAEKIAQETGRNDLILIGHSMGGMVSCWYATKLSSSVKAVITIGSPLAGTHVAHIGIGPNAREMRPHSPFIQELSQAISENKTTQFSHIAAYNDFLIKPKESAIIEKNQHLILEDIGHASLLYSRRVVAQVRKWL